MNLASRILLGIPNGKAVSVTFNDGEKLIIKDVDLVDEGVCDKDNILTGSVVEVLIPRKIKRPGILLQFAEEDIVRIEDETTRSVLYAERVQ